MCVMIFSTFLSKTFLILIRNEPDMFKMYTGLHVQYLFSCPISIKLKFSWKIFEKH